MATSPKLKFKKLEFNKIGKASFKNGYRLSTFSEVKEHWDDIKRWPLVEMEEDNKGICLLDACLLPRIDSPEESTSIGEVCDCCLVVKETDKIEGNVWKKKKSACYESNGKFLRPHVYDQVELTEEGRKTSLHLSYIHGDAEVIHWLIRTSDQRELEKFLQNLPYTSSVYCHGFKCLLTSEFPLKLPLQQDKEGKTVLDYFISFLESYASEKDRCVVFIDLLIELYKNNDILHRERSLNGPSLLEKATIQAGKNETWIPVLAKLLSECPQSVEDQISQIEHRFGDIFIEAAESGYAQLVKDLLKLKSCFEQLTTKVCLKIASIAVRQGYKDCLSYMLFLLKGKVETVFEQDKDGKTLFHYAAQSGKEEIFKLLAGAYEDEHGDRKPDKWGRNILHWAALNGQVNDCEDCVIKWQLKVNAKDIFGQNSVHMAAKGEKGHRVFNFLVKSSYDIIYETDDKGRTPLHLAATKGNVDMVERLLEKSDETYIQLSDGYGKTALQVAASGGHRKIVKLLLAKDGAKHKALSKRDVKGSTALHHSAKAKDSEVALAISQDLLNSYSTFDDRGSLLLWASEAGIGTAEERGNVHPTVKDFFIKRKKASEKTDLFKAAVKTDDIEMAWELLNRGAQIPDIGNRTEKQKTIIKRIERANEQGQDRPSSEDCLGRRFIADGIAALFLNKFIQSPITVGISGEWGMGKSSVMIQTEIALLMAASQIAFPNLRHLENFGGAKNMSLSSKGEKIYSRLKDAMSKLFASTGTKNPIVKLLNGYDCKHHNIYKSLASMDIHKQMVSSDSQSKSETQAMREVPRILTIRYNAWHYRDEHEAWAGLAVTITKEIEQTMTRAQRFSTYWRYSWDKHSTDIFIEIFWPCILAMFLAGWVAWAAWSLLKDSKFKNLTYESIPFTIIAIVWGTLKTVISVVQPVSTKMMGYITSTDHTAHLGYQEKVIFDINFLKRELGKEPHWFFSFITGEWCRNWFGICPDNVEDTCVPKFRPASEDQLRLIIFVDDLDRCDDTVILKVLSAINLVLGECKIDVILGIDKKMVQRAIERNFKENDDIDLVDKFICKIIQIPVSLPDPTGKDLDNFLEHHLVHPPLSKAEITVEDAEEEDFGAMDTDIDDVVVEVYTTPKNPGMTPDSCDCKYMRRLHKILQCSFQSVRHWLICFFQWRLPMSNEPDENENQSLTFSKGARLIREMLLLNYSSEEADTLYKLKGFVTGSQKLPREWKRFLDYYKFASTILHMIGKVYILPSWKVELVTWIFVCWQWKHQMNILIEGWESYTENIEKIYTLSFKIKGKEEEKIYEIKKHWYGPSLKQVVLNYLELEKLRKSLNIEAHSNKHDWYSLLEALEVRDVSMRGIQLFQQFRLHCKTDDLPWELIPS